MSTEFPHLFTVGITGKLATGKSTVRNFLEARGFTGIDCDTLVHELYEPQGDGAKKIRMFFEGSYLTKEGRVDRKKLFKTLLKHPKKWEVLNRLIHPLVAERLRRELRKVTNSKVVVEIPAFTERRFGTLVDEMWEITADESVQQERATERGIKPEELRLLNRIPRENHAPKKIIANNESLKELEIHLKASL